MSNGTNQRQWLKTLALFKKHPALVGTLLYVLVNALGVIYDWALFGEFGINVFDYAEINDFLLAAFREPKSLLLSFIFIILLIVYLHRYGLSMRRAEPLSPFLKMAYNRYVFVIGMLIYVFLVPYFAALYNMANIRKTSGYDLSVFLKVSKKDQEPRLVADKTALIGTTESMLFLLDKSNEKVVAIPRSNVHHIEF